MPSVEWLIKLQADAATDDLLHDLGGAAEDRPRGNQVRLGRGRVPGRECRAGRVAGGTAVRGTLEKTGLGIRTSRIIDSRLHAAGRGW